MDFDNNGFIISDSFYKAEYETPNYSIYDFYEIGSWNIEVPQNPKTPVKRI